MSSFDAEPELADGDSAEIEETNDKLSRDFYLQKIPLNDELLAASDDRIIEAIYGAGIIYKEKLENNKEAILSFEDLVGRYEFSKYQLPSYYRLYRLYLEQGNDEKANYYKNKLSKYPESEYWKIINDPNYKQAAEKQRIADKDKYERTFSLYRQGYYSGALKTANDVIANEPENFYLAKYYLLKALSLSGSGNLTEVEAILLLVIEKFPGSDEAVEAAGYLDLVKSANGTEDEGPFTFNSQEKHYFFVAFLKREAV